MFVTEVDSSRKKAVHDELARLLVQYIRQPDQDIATVLKVCVEGRGGWDGDHMTIMCGHVICIEHVYFLLTQHIWFFLEVMLKSMAQYLEIADKVKVVPLV